MHRCRFRAFPFAKSTEPLSNIQGRKSILINEILGSLTFPSVILIDLISTYWPTLNSGIAFSAAAYHVIISRNPGLLRFTPLSLNDSLGPTAKKTLT
jgi:hypothetical protein